MRRIGRRLGGALVGLAVALAHAAIAVGAATAGPALVPDSGATDETAYARALERARGGAFAEAAGLLEALVAHHPGNTRYLHDLIVVLGWAGRDADALAQLPRLDRASAPSYVLEALGKSARNTRRFDLAVELYEDAVRRDPRRIEALVGLGLARSDAGHAERGLAVLDAVAAKHPDRPDVQEALAYARARLWEQVEILAAGGRDAEVLAKVQGADWSGAPARVLRAAEDAARRLGQPATAAQFSEAAAARPDSVRRDEAVAELQAEAIRLEDARDFFGALAAYQRLRSLAPENLVARRGEIRLLDRIGAPHLALERADRDPGVLTPEERDALRLRELAITTRWGEIESERLQGEARFQDTDSALARSAALIAAWEGDPAKAEALRAVKADRIVALRQRLRMSEAIALYEALAAGGEVPASAQSAAAAAYLYEERPDAALPLYQSVAAALPEDVQTQLGLFFAYVESEDFDAAYALIDRLAGRIPPTRYAWSPVTVRGNPEYGEVRRTQAMARAYGDDLEEAQALLEAYRGEAPGDRAARQDLASVYNMRGWPRRAEAEARAALAVEPENAGLQAELAQALIDIQDYPAAGQTVEAAQAQQPRSKEVQRAAREWALHNRWELLVDAQIGRSDGGAPTGSDDWSIDTTLYSQPLADHYRVFVRNHLAEASFPNGDEERRRLGLGLEYRARDVTLLGEVSHGVADEGDAGVRLAGIWAPTDAWTLRLEGETSSDAVPLQARLAGVDAPRIAFDATYRVNESRVFGTALQYLHFDDGNDREIASAYWFERWVSWPHYRLETRLDLSASHNARENVPYFSPGHDYAPTLTVFNDWTLYRRYARSFRHRVGLTFGIYDQEGFGSKRISGFTYEHLWDWDRTFALRYGIGRLNHPFDGNQTQRDFAFFTLNWRF